MQKSNLDFSLLHFKIQIKVQHTDLVTFFFFVIYNRVVICQLCTISSRIQCQLILLLRYMNSLNEVCEGFLCLNRFICATKSSLVLTIDFPFLKL